LTNRVFVLEFVVYSRRGCHLCEELLEELEPLCRGRATIVVRDIDTQADWAEQYGLDIPVLTMNDDEICRHRLDRERVLTALAAIT
jgi:hypothetical protein